MMFTQHFMWCQESKGNVLKQDYPLNWTQTQLAELKQIVYTKTHVLNHTANTLLNLETSSL